MLSRSASSKSERDSFSFSSINLSTKVSSLEGSTKTASIEQLVWKRISSRLLRLVASDTPINKREPRLKSGIVRCLRIMFRSIISLGRFSTLSEETSKYGAPKLTPWAFTASFASTQPAPTNQSIKPTLSSLARSIASLTFSFSIRPSATSICARPVSPVSINAMIDPIHIFA